MAKSDIWLIVQVAAAAIALVFVMRWRKRGHARFLQEYAEQEMCEHLRPAWELLKSRGCVVVKAGQHDPDAPLELHIQPPFDPAEVAQSLKLEEPVFVSERNVLCCREDWCELHPR